MNRTGTLLITRKEVAELLSAEECMKAVEDVFRLYAQRKILPPSVMGIHTDNGGFHIKAGVLNTQASFFVAKINSNFPANRQQGLPIIQGVIAVYDGTNGQLLALIDSIEITVLRTGAATALAAKYLAREDSKVVTICGCGNQGRISARMLMGIRRVERIYAYDTDKAQADTFANELSKELSVPVIVADDLSAAVSKSDICVTCTPSRKPFLMSSDVRPGTFIAAVGADSEEKQEVESALLASNKVVVDLVEQCATIGELHHALKDGLCKSTDVHAELGDIIEGKKVGRTSDDEIIIFDSTGTALQDVAAATLVYKMAVDKGIGIKLDFA